MQSPDEIIEKSLKSADGSYTCEDFVSLVQKWLNKIQVAIELSFYILYYFKIYCFGLGYFQQSFSLYPLSIVTSHTKAPYNIIIEANNAYLFLLSANFHDFGWWIL